MGVLTTKPVEQCISDTEVEGHQLRRDLSALDLTVFGVGVTIGTGIFVLTRVAAATKAVTALVDLETLADLVNIGTLFAFVLVSIGVVVLRRTRPDLSARSAPQRCRWSPPWPCSPACS